MKNKPEETNEDFNVAVSWQMTTILKITAKNLNEALKIARKEIAIPEENVEYINDTFKVHKTISEKLN